MCGRRRFDIAEVEDGRKRLLITPSHMAGTNNVIHCHSRFRIFTTTERNFVESVARNRLRLPTSWNPGRSKSANYRVDRGPAPLLCGTNSSTMNAGARSDRDVEYIAAWRKKLLRSSRVPCLCGQDVPKTIRAIIGSTVLRPPRRSPIPRVFAEFYPIV